MRLIPLSDAYPLSRLKGTQVERGAAQERAGEGFFLKTQPSALGT